MSITMTLPKLIFLSRPLSLTPLGLPFAIPNPPCQPAPLDPVLDLGVTVGLTCVVVLLGPNGNKDRNDSDLNADVCPGEKSDGGGRGVLREFRGMRLGVEMRLLADMDNLLPGFDANPSTSSLVY